MQYTVAIGHDHAGLPLRQRAADVVEQAGHIPLFVSEDSAVPTDYPDVAAAVAAAIATGRANRGILICGSGAGVTVSANTYPHVRAALAHESYTASQMVEHDDVNVMTMGARVIGPELATSVFRAFLDASFSGEVRHARRLGKVLDQRRDLHPNALKQLADADQSIWLDTISRRHIEDGVIGRYIAELHVTGVTSNPSILQKAIGGGGDYDDRIAAIIKDGITDSEEVAFRLAITDLTNAADLLRPVFNASGGADGFVSLEVSPRLVHDTAGTVTAGKRLFELADRPNLMIKVPGTSAGLLAAEELLIAGVPVNVTLLFSPAQYAAAAEAFLNAIEGRLEAGLDPAISSVASVFVSRWDVAADPDLSDDLQGKLGVALMQETLGLYQDVLRSDRWNRLAAAGAIPQRVLWASTGTKNPDLPDTYYLGRLAAPGTVNTVPEATLLAFSDHGTVCDLLAPDHEEAGRCIAAVANAGVDVDGLASQLQNDGAEAFSASWQQLLESIETKIGELQ